MLTSKERSLLKSKGNTLKPSVNIGKGGLTENLTEEIRTVLFHNEIAKISVLKSCANSPKDLLGGVCAAVGCEPVSQMGGKFVVYKKSGKKDIEHLI